EAALRNAGEHATGGSGITQNRDGDPVTRAMWKYGKELGRLIGSTDDADVDTSRAVPVISEYDRPVVSLAAAGTSLKLGPVGSPAVAAFTQVTKAGRSERTVRPDGSGSVFNGVKAVSQ